jgi:hypothetical protein
MDLALLFWIVGFSQRYQCVAKILSQLVSDNAAACNFTVNGHEYNMEYYLVDGIYPEWATLGKTI